MEKQPGKNLRENLKSPLSRTRITLVSCDDRAAMAISGLLLSWDVRNIYRASNTGEAYNHIGQIVKDASTCHVVVVVKKGLNESPYQFSGSLDRMGALKHVRLLLVEDNRPCDAGALLEAAEHGYRAMVPSHEAVGDLLNAIHYVLPYNEGWGASETAANGRPESRPLLNVLIAEDNDVNKVVISRLLDRQNQLEERLRTIEQAGTGPVSPAVREEFVCENEIRDALREVIDPEVGIDIVDLGLIKDIRVLDTRVEIDMVLTCKACPLSDHLSDQVRRKVLGVCGKEQVIVNVLDEPWNWDRFVKQRGTLREI